MSTFGWTVSGLDPDPDATSPYLADIPLLRSQLGPGILPDNSYDAVTMSHVLEHMHQPAVALKCCFDALKPGGVMWLATPNLESPAHRAFGRYWYHLDTPRHVVLFTANALESLLRSTGFVPIQRLSSFWESARHVIEGSRRVMGRDALVPPAVGMPYMPLWRRTTIVLCAMLLGSKEELVYGCVKPLADPAPVTPNEHSVSDQRNSE